jgi:S-adenosylmethionine-diacylglycerol 3-amino-3-carboxypropyl transferase
MTITSGACNTLGFLLKNPSVIHTVDINPSQARVLALKTTAMTRLDHAAFIAFMGLVPADDRLQTYASLRSDLGPVDAAYWDERRAILRSGLLLAGRYDNFVRLVGRYIRLTHGRRRIDALLDAAGLDEQRAAFDRYWESRRTGSVFGLFYNKRVLARMGLEPDYFGFDDGSSSFADSFRRKFRAVMREVPAAGNYFAHIYLRGRYRSSDEAPEYLQAKHYETIRARLGRIKIHTGDAKVWLASMPAGTFDAFGLSNICELMSPADTRRMFEEVLRTARPGARLSFRNLVIPREVPDDLQDRIRLDAELSRGLKAADRSFVYSKVAAYRIVP